MKNTAVTDRINLYQMYDQTVEDFMVCEGGITIIEDGRPNIRFFNVSILDKLESPEKIVIRDNDEECNWIVSYSDVSNMRYYPDTHTLTITL